MATRSVQQHPLSLLGSSEPRLDPEAQSSRVMVQSLEELERCCIGSGLVAELPTHQIVIKEKESEDKMCEKIMSWAWEVIFFCEKVRFRRRPN